MFVTLLVAFLFLSDNKIWHANFNFHKSWHRPKKSISSCSITHTCHFDRFTLNILARKNSNKIWSCLRSEMLAGQKTQNGRCSVCVKCVCVCVEFVWPRFCLCGNNKEAVQWTAVLLSVKLQAHTHTNTHKRWKPDLIILPNTCLLVCHFRIATTQNQCTCCCVRY